MKIECSCGAKFQFEVQPEMRERPVHFVCPACGLDASPFVDSLVRREFGQTTAPEGTPIEIGRVTSAPTGIVIQSAGTDSPTGAIRMQNPVQQADPPLARPMVSGPVCLKHPGEVASSKCYVCGKPICPKCMELFGYVCSPLCKAKAGSHGIQIPIYQGQKSVIDAQRWRKVVWTSGAIAGLLAIVLSIWFWYAWFGCEPKVVFSVRFPEPAYSGQSAVAGQAGDQLVVLHGPILARYDLKSQKEIWSRQLIAPAQFKPQVDQQLKATKALIDKANSEAWEHVPKMPSAEELMAEMARDAAADLALYVRGQNVWTASPDKLVRYDWGTGKSVKEMAVQSGMGGPLYRGNELLLVSEETGKPQVTHIDLVTGETRAEELNQADAKLTAQNASDSSTRAANVRSSRPTESLAGLPTTAGGKDANKPMDPSKVAAQAQSLSLPQKLALPAVLAGNINQQRALNEMNDAKDRPGATSQTFEPGSSFSLIPTKDGFVEFSVKLLESRIVTRSAMKAASGKSVLDGDITAGKSMEMSNEMLNEMQRSNGGDIVEEDHSRYQVTLRNPGTQATWTGEVVGPPKLYPLETVNVLTADKLMIVLNKANQKLWQSTLGFNVVSGLAALDEESATYGQGPCVERKGTLYVFDQGVLSAFELTSGNARWRLPSVGIAGMFFDDRDMIYVNTTTATHESLKYSRQIDLSQKVQSIILKVDSRNGKILWSTESRGLVNYVSGRFILAAQSSIPDEGPSSDPDAEKHPWMRIRRINPSDGREVWDHFQERAPLDIAFDKNTIRLVFKREVQVLRFPRL